MNYLFDVELRTRVCIEDADPGQANTRAVSMWKDLLNGCPLESLAEGDVVIDHADQKWHGEELIHIASYYDLSYMFQVQVEAEGVAQAKQSVATQVTPMIAGSELARRHCTCIANIVMGQVSTLGYADPDASEYLAMKMSDPQTVLVDIRDNPVSRWRPQYNKKALQAQYGDRYTHVRELGNINHQTENAPIVLRDPDAGIARLHKMLLEGRSLVLMCACKQYKHCHRKRVYDLLMAALD